MLVENVLDLPHREEDDATEFFEPELNNNNNNTDQSSQSDSDSDRSEEEFEEEEAPESSCDSEY
jgi:hypothetical protein